MSITTIYTDDPNYSLTLPSSNPQTFTTNTTVAPEDGVDVTRVIDTANSWQANVNPVEITNELKILQKKDFTVDANTT